ncbi:MULTISPECIES: hypothetical protein [Bradyrhizobium]|uniref:Uncharacterized protein n=1 Tax=Bradyrhizobium arachidis TaxID=858423 RepID=A0AAE7TJD1_9BRAD|nr:MULTISPECIES: hypothetical protein [Bradyrhizobium]QOG20939.1 hypothetical protein FOM02_29965 [Bradyrhizobium sp. SEMIA]QOZ71257.1 hypothetical protein WN72_36980 [Bradyrhizobium arachidis]UFW47563.1 hypothetical protein BaraCB756_35690 [Bradyrhizobium arachidis]SFU48043.1 hypothetical protein SAMN05192541_102179 [Bradyrhizobium arachidis]
MRDASVAGSKVDFSALAVLHKWPSLANQRRPDRDTYQVSEGTLDQCISAFMGKPAATRHLYEIHTTAQPPLVTGVLSPEHVAELSRLREYL